MDNPNGRCRTVNHKDMSLSTPPRGSRCLRLCYGICDPGVPELGAGEHRPLPSTVSLVHTSATRTGRGRGSCVFVDRYLAYPPDHEDGTSIKIPSHPELWRAIMGCVARGSSGRVHAAPRFVVAIVGGIPCWRKGELLWSTFISSRVE